VTTHRTGIAAPADDRPFARARALQAAGDLDGAERLCREILARSPRDAATLHLLGFLELQRDRPGPAAALMRQALASGEIEPAWHLNLGFALICDGRADEAVASYEAAVALVPEWPAALNGLGAALQDSGRLEEAAEAFERACASDPSSADTLVNLGGVRTRLGRVAEALEALERAAEIAPGDAEVLVHLGDALVAASRFEEAARCYEGAAALAPDLAAAHHSLGCALERLGHPERAAGAYRRAIEIEPGHVDALGNLGMLLREAGRFPEAVDCLRRAVTARPDDATLERSLRGALARLLPAWHWPMIADEGRNDAYRRAIERAVDASSIVLDIGTGSGLLAMMAARAGAKRVVACEMSAPLAEAAREIVRANGFEDGIEVITGKSTALRVGVELPEAATVLISEIVDVGLLAEGVLPTVRHAVAHLIAPDAVVIPAGARIYARLVEVPDLRRVNPVRSLAGFDLRALDRFRAPDEYLDVDLAHTRHRVLSNDLEVARFDLRSPPALELEPRRTTFDVRATGDGVVHAVATWFALDLDEAITIDTRPGGAISAWGQALHFLVRDVRVRAGDTVTLTALVSDTRIGFELGDADRCGSAC
jgi:tetratricopeptide (TPR) repeat protein